MTREGALLVMIAVAVVLLALGAILPRCAVLVDGRRSDDETALGAASVVDVLPPFAGG